MLPYISLIQEKAANRLTQMTGDHELITSLPTQMTSTSVPTASNHTQIIMPPGKKNFLSIPIVVLQVNHMHAYYYGLFLFYLITKLFCTHTLYQRGRGEGGGRLPL